VSTRPNRRRARLRGRRGATIVLFMLLLVPLLTVAALALDVSQWQVGATQLQTVADAAAVAAARAAQLYPSTASDTAPLWADRVASKNIVLGSASSVSSANVQPGFWTPTTRTFATRTWAQFYNAVQVTATVNAGRSFAGVVRSSGPTISRSATAWIANINSGTCITPWGLPYFALYNAAVAASGSGTAFTGTVSSTNEPPNLTPTQLAALSSPARISARTIVLAYSTSSTTIATPSTNSLAAYSGNWQGYGYSGNNGQNQYQQSYWQCDNTNVVVGSQGGTTLSSVGQPDCWTTYALQGSTSQGCQINGIQAYTYANATGSGTPTCYYASPTTNGQNGSSRVTTYNATCYANSGTTNVGPLLRVTWSDLVGSGSNALKYREIGYVKLYCYFRGLNGSPGAGVLLTGGSAGSTNETCTVGSTTYTNLPMGTLVLVAQGLASTAINSGTVLDTIPGELQRLVIVR
jgi:Flp pilus assembly protein TadG